MGYQKITVPADGDKITVNADLSLNVPNHPVIPYIEGDGIGVDISQLHFQIQPGDSALDPRTEPAPRRSIKCVLRHRKPSFKQE